MISTVVGFSWKPDCFPPSATETLPMADQLRSNNVADDLRPFGQPQGSPEALLLSVGREMAGITGRCFNLQIWSKQQRKVEEK